MRLSPQQWSKQQIQKIDDKLNALNNLLLPSSVIGITEFIIFRLETRNSATTERTFNDGIKQQREEESLLNL